MKLKEEAFQGQPICFYWRCYYISQSYIILRFTPTERKYCRFISKCTSFGMIIDVHKSCQTVFCHGPYCCLGFLRGGGHDCEPKINVWLSQITFTRQLWITIKIKGQWKLLIKYLFGNPKCLQSLNVFESKDNLPFC